MNELTIWLTYHDDSLINLYGLQETETVKLFKANDTTVTGENINQLNQFYGELTTMYYVWKNNLKSKLVGFEHYRRQFNYVCNINPGEFQAIEVSRTSVFIIYKKNHNYQDFYDLLDVINQKFGEGNKYSDYLMTSRFFISKCCFIMNWEDFDKLCNFVFPLLFELDKMQGLNMNPEAYIQKTKRDFRYDSISHQQRTMAYLAERLISCYLNCEMTMCQENQETINNSYFKITQLI